MKPTLKEQIIIAVLKKENEKAKELLDKFQKENHIRTIRKTIPISITAALVKFIDNAEGYIVTISKLYNSL